MGGDVMRDKNYDVAQRIQAICKDAPDALTAEAVVIAEFPYFDLSVLRVMGCYFHRFVKK